MPPEGSSDKTGNSSQLNDAQRRLKAESGSNRPFDPLKEKKAKQKQGDVSTNDASNKTGNISPLQESRDIRAQTPPAGAVAPEKRRVHFIEPDRKSASTSSGSPAGAVAPKERRVSFIEPDKSITALSRQVMRPDRPLSRRTSDPERSVANVEPKQETATWLSKVSLRRERGKAADVKGEVTEATLRAKQISQQFQPHMHLTDKGNLVRGRTWDMEFKDNKEEDRYVSVDLNKTHFKGMFGDKIKLIADPHPDYNCHSYTFTNGRGGWLTDNNVQTILKDNDFKPIASESHWQSKPEAGDVIVYGTKLSTSSENITHTGVVSRVEGENIYIQSKWGKAGMWEHPASVVPDVYGKEWTIYRTERPQGRLVGRID